MATKPKPSMSPLEGGGPLQPAAAVILYNHRTGVIFSTHYFSTVDDAQLPDKDELERVALEHAAKDGCKVSTHKALHVDPAPLKRGVGYRVAKGKLTEVRQAALGPNLFQLADPRHRDSSMFSLADTTKPAWLGPRAAIVPPSLTTW